MNNLSLTDKYNSSYKYCILSYYLHKTEILEEYVDKYGIDRDSVIVLSLDGEPNKKKPSVSFMKSFLEDIQVTVEHLAVKYIICTDAEYFKVLTKTTKADANLGYVLPSCYGNEMVVYVPSFKGIFYDPIKVRDKIEQSMQGLLAHSVGMYSSPGSNIIHSASYPRTLSEIERGLNSLLEMNCPLAIDIEAYSLKAHTAGIGTIAFAWDQHNGLAFAVDYEAENHHRNEPVRALLRNFFLRSKCKHIYHNISYDVMVLIYQLFMDDITDTKGLLFGLKIMLNNWDDTKLITYLATNSCAGNQLSLKVLAQEFAGNYAQADIKDITKIPLPELLEYNLVDAISTYYVHDKYVGVMKADQQEDVYESLFKPAIVDIIQMQLTGMPLNMQRVLEVEQLLTADFNAAMAGIVGSPLVQEYQYQLNEEWVQWKNKTLKKKRVTLADANKVFNPNSDPQLRGLLYDKLGLPVIELTASKQAATDSDSLKALLNHTTDPQITSLLGSLLDLRSVEKILTVYIPAFKNAVLGKDGWHYLCGNFNLGGTVSGRLSSSDPNLQNLPSGSAYGKLIKSCFQAPDGWVFAGLDFASLEDRISALTTKDENKLKVYLDGFDGHCLRAAYYFRSLVPDIDLTDPVSVNSLKKTHPKLRDRSKAPTFLLTYGGTYIGLVKKCGFTEAEALDIESQYHQLYKESDDWVAAKLEQAAKDGYVTVAFGLRVRTPLLHQVLLGNSRTPFEAQAEGRTAGNALGQSWGLLNSRASVEFMSQVREDPLYRTAIRPCAHIHDAQYYLIRDDLDVIQYINMNLVKAVEWQEDPAISHPDVTIGGELDLFWPSWADGITLPNGATEDEIIKLVHTTLTSE